MKKRLSLLKPYLHTAVLDNKIKEKVTYLNIPTSVDVKSLSADIKKGAVQFSDLKGLLEKKKEPKYILITANNLEQGYMAVTYLAAGFNSKYEYGLDEEWEAALDHTVQGLDEWKESIDRVPVIEEDVLRQNFGSQDYPFGFGNMLGQARMDGFSQDPYWMHCTNYSICIVCDEDKNPFFEQECGLFNSLNYFQNNDKIYVVVVKRWENPMWYEPEEEEGVGIDIFEDTYRRKWNSTVLNFSMDEVSVKLEGDAAKNYYKLLYQGVFASWDISAGKGFSYMRLANITEAMSEPRKCQLVENIVKYAIKEWDSSAGVISNKDFDFMDRFCKKRELFWKKNGNVKKVTAIDRMMEGLVGLEEVKKQVLGIINVMKYNQMRAKMGIDGGSYHNVHVMLGAPGTAKTTVARLMGEIMAEMFLLSDTRFACVNGAELKGMYVGHSAPKTKKLFEENDIIVIDEAYSLVGDHGENDMFSKEAIAQMIIELEKHSMDKLVIFAGYGGKKVSRKNNKMKEFIDANPGIKSRITSTIYFDSYNPEEMVKIFYKMAQKQHFRVEESARDLVYDFFEKRIQDENFGNGREARSLLETAIMFTANRVFGQDKKKYTKTDMQAVTYQDVEHAVWQAEYQEDIQNASQSEKTIGFCI